MKTRRNLFILQKRFARRCLWVYCSLFTLPLAVGQAMKQCAVLSTDKPTCSYAGLNGSCAITIDRLNPVTPPTIYAKPNAVITVTVINPSPFEDLTLDWKSTTAVLPPDSFSNVFSALTGSLGKITIVGQRGFVRGAIDISADQQKLLQKIQPSLTIANLALEQVKEVLQPPPFGVCSTDVIKVQPWLDPDGWKNKMESILQSAIGAVALSEVADRSKDLKKQVDALGLEIEILQTATQAELAILNVNQVTLINALNQRQNLGLRLASLLNAIRLIPSKGFGLKGPTEIHEFPSNDKSYQSQVWVLNYTNKLVPVAKTVSAQNFTPDSGVFGGLADTPTKQTVATLTIQFQSSPRLEVSSGLMVPITPYHSYSAAAVATNGTVTGNVVQETTTYTVVPMVSVNVLLKEFIPRRQRAALFGSAAVGYNPVTSSVEFGPGMSFSWHSVVLTASADIGRDTHLAGGFTVGQTLPASNPSKPLTTTAWGVKPALALSIRIPLGGTAK